MGRVLALDVGRKRTGIAVTDPLRLSCSGLPTLPTGEVADFIARYCQGERVDVLVVGAPRTLRNEVSEAERYIIPVLNRIRKLAPDLRVDRHDERFTSKMAQGVLLSTGAPRMVRRSKGLVDRVSAVLILESYLEMLALHGGTQ